MSEEIHPYPTTTTPIPRTGAGADHEQPLRVAAAAGDHDAFGLLYRQYRETVFRYVLRRSNGDPHLADDLTQDTFARAFARIGSYQEMGRPLVAWLLTIAANLLADHYKSAWRRLQVTRGHFASEIDESRTRLMWTEVKEDLASAVVEHECRRQVAAILLQAMADLTDWQRTVLQLRFVEGLSVRDTALKLDVELGAVKAATYRAMRTLARNPVLQRLRAERGGGHVPDQQPEPVR